MPLDFKFPDVGEGTTEGTLIKWLVKEGDTIKADQPLAEIETDKAVVEIPAPRAGVILKLFGKAGEIVKVGSVLAQIGDAGERSGIGMTPTPSPAGIPSKPVPAAATTPPQKPAANPMNASAGGVGSVLATPSTRQLARQLGIDITTLKGTGPAGRITDDDVKRAQSLGGNAASTPKPTPTSTLSSPVASPNGMGPRLLNVPSLEPGKPAWKPEGTEERIPIKGIRKTISDRMVKSMFTAVQVTHMDEVDVTELVKLREKKKEELKKKGISLTYLAFVVKASVAALKNHPWMNASIDDASGEAVYKRYYHIGIAVDTEDGLMVVVIRDADKKSIVEIAKEMQTLAQQARERTVAPENLRGSTFTITNIGSLGGTYATPVINWPEVGILGLGKIAQRPVVVEGKIMPRHMMTVSLTFDHRLIDGAQAVRFCNEVLQHLEDPGLFLVDVV
ncbi:MAG: 2-oxo acid dehydrogenase subunit E2 [Candidatus Iainarchaeum archaeon]|uniref:2-oxo acid dehydrogenase subunit E2 n=1 Tax=Candidatus Iainarchaeum sp. TaxID=3101447 RepID=A0A7T9I1B9_9ARCH|nr:MAG: 2-oxo acid dehydrogenase subunit E2 [Candidatus Diapherotrites archaeon]